MSCSHSPGSAASHLQQPDLPAAGEALDTSVLALNLSTASLALTGQCGLPHSCATKQQPTGKGLPAHRSSELCSISGKGECLGQVVRGASFFQGGIEAYRCALEEQAGFHREPESLSRHPFTDPTPSKPEMTVPVPLDCPIMTSQSCLSVQTQTTPIPGVPGLMTGWSHLETVYS